MIRKSCIVVICKQGMVLKIIKYWYLNSDLVFLCSIVLQLLKGVKIGRENTLVKIECKLTFFSVFLPCMNATQKTQIEVSRQDFFFFYFFFFNPGQEPLLHGLRYQHWDPAHFDGAL